jgi:hypothetical protein
MWSLTLLCIFSLLIYRALAEMPNDVAGPFGLTITSTTIFASRINNSGSVELNQFPITSAFKATYHDAVCNFHSPAQTTDERQANLTSMFHQAIAPVTEGLGQIYGEQPTYASLFIPSVFRTDEKFAAVEATFADARHTYKFGTSEHAMCHEYRFIDRKNLGRQPEECSEDELESFILFLDNEGEYSYVWLMEVALELGTYYKHYKKICIDCGENSRQVGLQLNLPRSQGYHADRNVRYRCTSI